MNQFQHHPAGLIYVRTAAVTYSDTLSNFALDFGQAVPVLPDGFAARIYEPGVRHAISDGAQVIGGPMPWTFGDDAIAAVASIIAAQTARTLPPPPTSEQRKAALLAQVDGIRSSRLAAGFADAATGKTWQCDDASIGKWTALAASAGLAIAMNVPAPPSYQLIPADNSIITLTAAETFALLASRVMPWVSATIIYARTMKNDILADNPPADVTAGWP